jgi:hypothetical protein
MLGYICSLVAEAASDFWVLVRPGGISYELHWEKFMTSSSHYVLEGSLVGIIVYLILQKGKPSAKEEPLTEKARNALREEPRIVSRCSNRPDWLMRTLFDLANARYLSDNCRDLLASCGLLCRKLRSCATNGILSLSARQFLNWTRRELATQLSRGRAKMASLQPL